MRQTRLFFTAPQDEAAEIAAILEDALAEQGVPVAAFEADEATSNWEVSIYVPSQDTDNSLNRITKILSSQGHTHQIGHEALPQIDWVTATLRDMPPVRAGRFLVHGSHDLNAPKAGDIAIRIDAGQAFGTGHHGTTAGCLDVLNACLKRRNYRKVLDLGTGSGVLAIAAAKSTNACILASDIDPVAISVARENARNNRQAARIDFLVASGFSNHRFSAYEPFDLIVANILAGPLQALSRDLARHTTRGGTVILSGLLPHQKARIVAHYRLQGLRLVGTHHRDGWMTLLLGN